MLTEILQIQNKWQFSRAFDRVDASHIPMRCPRGGTEVRKEHYNFTNFYSVVMMRIVEADYKSLWTSVRLLGSSNNACTFQAS